MILGAIQERSEPIRKLDLSLMAGRTGKLAMASFDARNVHMIPVTRHAKLAIEDATGPDKAKSRRDSRSRGNDRSGVIHPKRPS